MSGRADLAYEQYRSGGSDEWLMRIGAPEAPPILFLPPLLEELNRTRAFMAGVMRRLARRGFCCWLPDLPGTGESERPLGECGWEDWGAAAAASAEHVRSRSGKPVAAVAIRGGALLDGRAGADCHWRFAPVTGASLVRDLDRAGLAGGRDSAGYDLSEGLRSDLAAAAPPDVRPLRVARLASDPAEADGKLEGPALWRRSEPANSVELGEAVASDIYSWVKSCGVF